MNKNELFDLIIECTEISVNTTNKIESELFDDITRALKELYKLKTESLYN